MIPPLRFYWVVTVSGAIFMAFEILASRVLAPHFGSSVYVWGSIISVFLAALSIGYAWGGRLADRNPTMGALARLIALAAAFQALLLLWGEPLAAWLSRLTGGAPSGTLLAAAVLFGPTSILFGTVSPYAVRLATSDLERVGNTAGRLYALSTVGSLAGTLICTFLLIPRLALPSILGSLLLLTAATALVALGGEVRRERLTAALAGALVLFAAISIGRPEREESGVLYQRITPYQSLKVLDGGDRRYLQSDRVNHGAVRLADGEPGLTYPRYAPAALLVNPDIRRLLVLGMGSGSVGSYLQSRLPGLAVDYVEIDPAVPDVARRFLMFEDNPGTSVHIADGRRFLAASDRRWDYIYCDVYVGLAIPFHLTTIEFLTEVRQHLTPEGLFAFNLAGSLDAPFARAIYRTVAEAFPTVTAFAVAGTGNHLILATRAPRALEPSRLTQRAGELDKRWTFEPTLGEIASRQLAIDFELTGQTLLTDSFAPVEHLVLLPASADLPPAPEN